MNKLNISNLIKDLTLVGRLPRRNLNDKIIRFLALAIEVVIVAD